MDACRSLTLATLPPDVIRKIITCDVGETMSHMPSISHSWNDLVTEYLEQLPPIKSLWAFLSSSLEVDLVVPKKSFKYIENILPKERRLTQEKDDSMMAVNFKLSSEDHCLTRIYKCKIRIQHLCIYNFDKENFENLCKWIPKEEIQTMRVYNDKCDIECRNNVMEFIKNHRVREILYDVGHYSYNEPQLHKLLRSISTSTQIVIIDDMFGANSENAMRSLTSVVDYLIDKKVMKSITIRRNGEVVYARHEPYLEFMRNFCCCYNTAEVCAH